MKPEIEVKVLHVDHDELRDKLKALGATCKQPMRLMKRKTYDFSDQRLRNSRNGWVRVRDEGDKITMSYKQLDNRDLDGTKEVNLTIDSFVAADAFLTTIGLQAEAYQVTKRESWHYENFEIELDIWPWVDPYIEIEGPDEHSLKSLASKLGLDWSKACHGSVEIVYRDEYDVTDDDINDIPVITFDEPLPQLLKDRKKQ